MPFDIIQFMNQCIIPLEKPILWDGTPIANCVTLAMLGGFFAILYLIMEYRGIKKMKNINVFNIMESIFIVLLIIMFLKIFRIF